MEQQQGNTDAEPATTSPRHSNGPTIGVGLGGSCPNCRAAVDLGQRYCLECGADATKPPKPAAVVRPTGRGVAPMPVKQKKFPWVPLTLLVLILVAGLTYVLVASDDGSGPGSGDETSSNDSASEAIKELESSPASDEATEDPNLAFPDQPTDGSTTDESGSDGLEFPDETGDDAFDEAAGADTSDASSDWPAGQEGHTIVIASYSKDVYQRSQANSRSAEVQASGIESGVLDSDGFETMAPGFWVVFSGQYDSQVAAEADLPDVIEAGNVGAYVKEVA